MKGAPSTNVSLTRIFKFWVPLAATWLMMAVEGPFLAAIIARLGNPTRNLAAWGVAFTVAIIFEAPIIMIMSASTALARNRNSYRKLRNFTYLSNVAITAAMILLLATPAFDFVMVGLIRLPEDVAELTWGALVIFLPWPAAIGFRRFYQGLLIRNDQTRRVAYGTVVRMTTMAAVACVLFFGFSLQGALVGAAAASSGVILEGITSRLMAMGAIKKLLGETGDEPEGKAPLTYRKIFDFYYPLALTSVITLAVHPMITFFVGRSRFALESLAVIPVVASLSFVFRSMGLSYQEVGIALIGDRNENYEHIKRFALLLGFGASAALSAIAFTPLAGIWYERVAGLTAELAIFALLPTCIHALLPFIEVQLSFQRSVLVNAGRTAPVTWATVIDVATIIAVLIITISGLDMVGVTAAALAMLLGRLAGNIYLIPPRRRALNQSHR